MCKTPLQGLALEERQHDDAAVLELAGHPDFSPHILGDLPLLLVVDPAQLLREPVGVVDDAAPHQVQVFVVDVTRPAPPQRRRIVAPGLPVYAGAQEGRPPGEAGSLQGGEDGVSFPVPELGVGKSELRLVPPRTPDLEPSGLFSKRLEITVGATRIHCCRGAVAVAREELGVAPVAGQECLVAVPV
ncbi:hypothetical protein PG985_000465 [Apiospora marii]|uniref:Uncharacterized protein n=1 Tax=Apiospora marii TaxID=335849 RepID=A0ABR1R2U0_9PEZI